MNGAGTERNPGDRMQFCGARTEEDKTEVQKLSGRRGDDGKADARRPEPMHKHKEELP